MLIRFLILSRSYANAPNSIFLALRLPWSKQDDVSVDAMIFKGALLVVVVFLGYHLYKLIHRLFIAPLSSHLGDLPGPKPKSLIWGSFKEINDAGPGELHAKWVEEYGPTMSYKVSSASNEGFKLMTDLLRLGRS